MKGQLVALATGLVMLPAVFWPLERLFPARRGQRWLRPRLLTDLAFMAGQYLVFSAVALFTLQHVARALDHTGLGALRSTVAALPFAAQAALAVLLGDVSVYWFHVACHRVPWLWRFHAVHHSARHLDWLAAHREHPVDGILTQLAINLPAMALGVDLTLLSWLVALRGVWAIFIHANVRLPLGPLRVLLGAPELHHWHHLATRDTRHNFANLAPWTDLLFGTWHLPPEGDETWALGVADEPERGYLAHLLAPFIVSTSRRGAAGAAATPLRSARSPRRACPRPRRRPSRRLR